MEAASELGRRGVENREGKEEGWMKPKGGCWPGKAVKAWWVGGSRCRVLGSGAAR